LDYKISWKKKRIIIIYNCFKVESPTIGVGNSPLIEFDESDLLKLLEKKKKKIEEE